MPARIVVADAGTGIPEDQLPFIFDRFRTGDDGQSRGTGLGLPLVRTVARAHGGDVTVRSACGTGSEFELTLPVPGRRALAAPPPSRAAADRMPTDQAAASQTAAYAAEDQGSARR
jgi:nitrogen-specific signal transduction histidine kinase